ncbi:MAG: 30S ribosomal protein S9 [Bacteroidetes bacterium]|nr:30S ribosomal protein S9 [Bacteroidia bacterium]PCH68675.1 MAG: 30S ribosomal protein S9 [Bacteroidota bacterium]
MQVTNAIGRRKTSVARVYLTKGKGNVTINKKGLESYFTTANLQRVVKEPFIVTETKDQFDIIINIDGGGITGQAEAARLAISRALVKINEENKPSLKQKGFLTRDPRMVERKKPGLKKARKSSQFSKR